MAKKCIVKTLKLMCYKQMFALFLSTLFCTAQIIILICSLLLVKKWDVFFAFYSKHYVSQLYSSNSNSLDISNGPSANTNLSTDQFFVDQNDVDENVTEETSGVEKEDSDGTALSEWITSQNLEFKASKTFADLFRDSFRSPQQHVNEMFWR